MKNLLKHIRYLLFKKAKMILQRLLAKKDPNEGITYSGIYLNFREVQKRFISLDQYSSPEQFCVTAEQAKKLLSGSEAESFVNIGWASQRLNFLPNFLSALDLESLKILDIGGGFGETYLHVKRSTKCNIRYDIIEIEKTVEAGTSIFRNNHDLNFFTLDSYSNDKYDLVYFGSSLQYFENWREIIKIGLVSDPKFVLISDTTVGEVPTFVCAQVNDSRTIIPRWVFNIEDLDILFSTFGYSRVLRTSNYYPFHNFYNYEGEYRNIEHSNLVFERKE